MAELPVSKSMTDKNHPVDQKSTPRQEFMFDLESPVDRQEQLLFSEYRSDVIFQVGSIGQLIHAHTLILSIASEVFYAQFNGDFKEAKQDNRHNPIVIKDIEPEIFKQILCYIYCQKVDLTPKNVMDIYCGSEKYLLTGLKRLCDNFLETVINAENVVKVLDSNQRYGFENVNKLCLDIIQDNPLACFEDKDFLTLCQGAVELIATCRTMNCQKDQFQTAIERWCKANNSKANIIPQQETIQCDKLFMFSNFRYDNNISTNFKINVKAKMYLYGLGIFIGAKPMGGSPANVTVRVEIGPGNATVCRTVPIKKNLYVEKVMFKKLTVTNECHIIVTLSQMALFCLDGFKPVDTLGPLELTVTDLKKYNNYNSSNRVYPFEDDYDHYSRPQNQKTNCVAYLLYSQEALAASPPNKSQN